MSRIRCHRKKFLNKRGFHSVANIMYESSESLKDNWSPYYAEFHISNCDRTITLEIDVNDLKNIDNSIHKMETLRGVCEAAIEDLKGIREGFKVWKKEKDKKNKPKKDSNEEDMESDIKIL